MTAVFVGEVMVPAQGELQPSVVPVVFVCQVPADDSGGLGLAELALAQNGKPGAWNGSWRMLGDFMFRP